MIRFACPKCNAVYTVEDSKGGKTGKCPKCDTQFLIPMPAPGDAVAAEAAVAPSPAPPPAATGSNPVEVAPCPSCFSRLTVLPGDVGKDVECPSCQNVFTAMLPGSNLPAKQPERPSRVHPVKAERDDDDDDDDGKSSRRRRYDDEDEDDRPSGRRSRYNEEDDDDDRPRKKKKRRRQREESKRIPAGILAILLGGLGVHKFYLGYTGAGIVMIILSCFGVGGIIGLVEGIIYITKTDDEFIDIYQRGTKEWF